MITLAIVVLRILVVDLAKAIGSAVVEHWEKARQHVANSQNSSSGGGMNAEASKIRDACEAGVADPKLAPILDTQGNVVETKCNLFVNQIASLVGYAGFSGLLANAMVDLMASSKEWSEVHAAQAVEAATQGMLVVAGHRYLPHGHVAIVLPGGGLVYAGKWQQDVPVVASVGQENKICGANYAFLISDTSPSYFCWTQKKPD